MAKDVFNTARILNIRDAAFGLKIYRKLFDVAARLLPHC